MKKLFLLVLLLIPLSSVLAVDNADDEYARMPVKFVNCLSSTSLYVENDSKKFRLRLLAIDTEDGELNREIEEYVCSTVKNAQKLEIQYDRASSKKDKYNRDLVWLYVDDVTLQELLLARGYGQVNFIQGEYANLDHLCSIQRTSIINKLGIWNYPDIEEAYCQSGLDIHSDNPITNASQTEDIKKYDTHKLYYLIFLNALIILLLLSFKIRKVGI